MADVTCIDPARRRYGFLAAKGIEMGRFVLLVVALAIGIAFVNPERLDPGTLRENFWLVALFPAVYILGFGLLKD